MPTEPQPPTLAEVVDRAVAVCDPAGEHDAVADLLRRFEDRDEPVTAIADIDAELAEATRSIDPEADEPALTMAAAVAAYLARRRSEMDDHREDILRLAARAEFDEAPPAAVGDWLAAQGVHG